MIIVRNLEALRHYRKVYLRSVPNLSFYCSWNSSCRCMQAIVGHYTQYNTLTAYIGVLN
jgi:hypothetical protein